MKITPLKRSKMPLKRSKLKKTSKVSISKIQHKIWNLLRNIIRQKYGNTCYTCSRTGLSGANWQTGHMWPKASVGAYLKYDPRILRPQCYHCNINLGGNGAVFYSKMLKEIGEEVMIKLERDRQVIVKAMDHYQKILEEYKKL